MYAIVTTTGFIIASNPRGEAGKLLSIFTRDLGLVMASAQGIRLEKSKLRYSTADYSFGNFSFIRGREFWRLIDAKEIGVTLTQIETKRFMSSIALLLRRLLNGEEPHPDLFDCIFACVNFLSKSSEISNEQIQTLESLTVARVLHRLGYVGSDKDLNAYLESFVVESSLLELLKDKRMLLNKHINKALKESQL